MINQGHHIIKAFLIFLTCCSLIFVLKKFSSGKKQVVSYPSSVNTSKPDISNNPHILKGKTLYNSNCGSCHLLSRGHFNLAEVLEREQWQDREKLYKWINNPAEFIKIDTYARKLSEAFLSTMPAFPNLSNEDIDAIIDYIRSAKKVELPLPVANR